jgi:hypothetical protein
MIKGVRTYDNKLKNIIIKVFEPALFPFNLSLSFFLYSYFTTKDADFAREI